MPTKAWNSETIRWLLSAEHSELRPTEAQRPGGSFEVLGTGRGCGVWMRKDSNEQNPSNRPRSRTSSKAEAQAEDTMASPERTCGRAEREPTTNSGRRRVGGLAFGLRGERGGGASNRHSYHRAEWV